MRRLLNLNLSMYLMNEIVGCAGQVILSCPSRLLFGPTPRAFYCPSLAAYIQLEGIPSCLIILSEQPLTVSKRQGFKCDLRH